MIRSPFAFCAYLCVLCLLLLSSCATTRIRGSGAGIRVARSTSKPVLDPTSSKKTKKRIKTCYEEEKTNPKPVCFSCDNAVRIINAKQRLQRWPKKAERMVKFAKKNCVNECEGKVATQKARTKACRKQKKILLREAEKRCKRSDAYLIGGIIGGLVGMTAGVLLTVMIYQFSSPGGQALAIYR
jgi:hypothetical protein